MRTSHFSWIGIDTTENDPHKSAHTRPYIHSGSLPIHDGKLTAGMYARSIVVNDRGGDDEWVGHNQPAADERRCQKQEK